MMYLDENGNISIHAAREGGDIHGTCPSTEVPQFQSTPPVKAATQNALKKQQKASFQSTPPVKAATLKSAGAQKAPKISIHAAREGGDLVGVIWRFFKWDFNPRRP